MFKLINMNKNNIILLAISFIQTCLSNIMQIPLQLDYLRYNKDKSIADHKILYGSVYSDDHLDFTF
jgi:hypothetical protein